MAFTHWGKWDEPVLASSVWMRYYDGSIFKKISLSKLTGKVMDLCHDYYYWAEDFEVIKKRVLEALEKKNYTFFKNIFKYIQREHANKKKFCNEIKYAAESLTKEEQIKKIKQLFRETKELMGCWILMFHLSGAVEEYLRKEAKEQGITLEEIFAAVNPPRETLLMQYETAWRTIARKVQQRRQQKRMNTEILHLLKEFGWVGTHSYRGDGLTKKQLLWQIKNAKERKQEKKQRRNFPKKIEEAIAIASEMAYYRMTSAERYNKMNYECRPLMNNVAKQLKVTYNQLIFMTFPEIIKSLQELNVKTAELNERMKAYGIITKGDGVEIFTGERLKNELKKYTQAIDLKQPLKGIVAFKGKATGIVKIVGRPDQTSKINVGDILVAPETTPDLILAMEKAAAFITDAGGITSHAAIVAREMKKPCIVGTKVATTVLKDGDLVEVDADKGVVKVLKKND